MFGALLKKQLLETFSGFLQNRKTGKSRKGAALVGFIILYIFLFFMIGVMFFTAASSMCEPLSQAGLGWLYFALMGLLSIMFGILGSVFNTYASLYKSKDNEFLLSLPIPPRFILIARLLSVGLWSFVYVGVVFIPTIIVFWLKTSPTFLAVVFDVILILLLAIFVLTLSCILGWVVAKIAGKLKNKNIVTVAASLVFIALYYWLYSKAYSYLQFIISNADAIGQKIRGVAYPLYLMGKMGEGDFVSAVLFALIIAAFFVIVFLVLSRTFIKIAASNHAAAKTKYKEKSVKGKSRDGALLQKEFRRYLGSPTYMLNCSLGSVMILILGVVVLVKSDIIQKVLFSLSENAGPSLIPFVICIALCVAASMNDVTAPSISLEGKNIWIAQSLPVSAWQVLKSKIKLHLWLTEIPVLFCSVCFVISARLSGLSAFFVILIPLIFVLLSASFGLFLNLKMPNLTWTNEAAPVKQSLCVTIALFSGMIFQAVVGAVYFLLRNFVSVEIFLLILALLVSFLSGLILGWLKTKGARIFERL